jgi:hypothetical protein
MASSNPSGTKNNGDTAIPAREENRDTAHRRRDTQSFGTEEGALATKEPSACPVSARKIYARQVDCSVDLCGFRWIRVWCRCDIRLLRPSASQRNESGRQSYSNADRTVREAVDWHSSDRNCHCQTIYLRSHYGRQIHGHEHRTFGWLECIGLRPLGARRASSATDGQ